MYVDRIFEGETSKPWQGGTFGFTRTPVRIAGQVIMTKFHEGIDVSPLRRDSVGNPLDPIRSISDGKVVHVSDVSGRSSYGKYLVIMHEWEDSKIYSLYAHVAKIYVKVGDEVKAGSEIALMGYTGVGLNRTRSHLHLELAFLMSEQYESWHAKKIGSRNFHGIYNGMNLAGIDLGKLYHAKRENPALKFSEFVLSQPTHFKVLVPFHSGKSAFLKRHPWMNLEEIDNASSWEIGFSATGHPISFKQSARAVSQPTLSHIRPSQISQRWLTRGLVSGEGSLVKLSSDGLKMLGLLLDDF